VNWRYFGLGVAGGLMTFYASWRWKTRDFLNDAGWQGSNENAR
jgi:hypothetical protein